MPSAAVMLDRQAKFTLLLFGVLAVTFVISSFSNELLVMSAATTTQQKEQHQQHIHTTKEPRKSIAVVFHRGGGARHRSRFISKAARNCASLAQKIEADFYVVSKSWPEELQSILAAHDTILLFDGTPRESLTHVVDVSSIPAFIDYIKDICVTHPVEADATRILYEPTSPSSSSNVSSSTSVWGLALRRTAKKAIEALRIWEVDEHKVMDSALECLLESGVV